MSEMGTRRMVHGTVGAVLTVLFSISGVVAAQSIEPIGNVHALAYSPDGTRLAAASDVLIVLDSASLDRVWRVDAGGEARTVAFLPSGAGVVSGHRDGSIRVWTLDEASEPRAFEGHKRSVNALDVSTSGDRLVSASSDRTVRVWDVTTGKVTATAQGHTQTVNSVAFSADGRRVASAASDSTVRIWDAKTGENLATLTEHTSSVWSVVWSPDDRFLASCGWDGTVRIWDATSGTCLQTHEVHDSHVRGVAFSSDGRHIASASWDRTVRVLDLADGKTTVLHGHSQPVQCLAYRPDGRALASGSLFETAPIRVWSEGIVRAPAPIEALAPTTGDATPPADAALPVRLRPDGPQAWRDGTHPEETHAAIQDALTQTAADTMSTPVVNLPPGDYLIHKPLSLARVTLRGPAATIHARNTGERYYFGLTLGYGAVLEDIAIRGEGARCVPVRLANPARRVRLRRVHIEGGTILMNGQAHIEDIVFDDCLFEGGGYGLLLDRPSSGRNVRVVNCTFRNNRSDAIELNFPHEDQGKTVEDIVISHCMFEGTGPDPDSGSSGFAIGMAGARSVQIVGNTFRRAAVQAIHIEDNSENIVISGNNMVNCGLDHTGGNWTGGVHILSGSRHITITGNNFINCRFGVSGLQGGTLRWCTVTGNTFRNCEIGVRIMEFPHGVVQGNLFRDCQTAINIWRTPFWNVCDNQIVSRRPGAVGLTLTRRHNLVIVDNTIQAPQPILLREFHDPEGILKTDNRLIPLQAKH